MEAKTLTDQAYQRLREDIVHSKFEPGEKLGIRKYIWLFSEPLVKKTKANDVFAMKAWESIFQQQNWEHKIMEQFCIISVFCSLKEHLPMAPLTIPKY